MQKTGTVLNNIYRVVTLLGKGSMGNVYLVERIKDDKKFVIKELIFTESVGIEPDTAREIFFREAEFMVKFDHRGLPKMYGIFSQEEKDYLVMDYIEGKTLEEIISNETIEKDKAIKWTVELAEILDYLHNSFHKPIVYRDLKPSNIIITPEGKATLVDFGIARYYNPDKNTDTFSYGSPGYAAPEQYKGRGQSTPQSDVFGLGVILFQMLTGYGPSIKPFTFPPMELSDKKLVHIVMKAIELDPLKRYISIVEFKEGLEKYSGKYESPFKKSPSAGITIVSKIMIALASIAILTGNALLFFNNPPMPFMANILLSIFIAFIAFILWGIVNFFINAKKKKINEYPLLTRIIFLTTIIIMAIGNGLLIIGSARSINKGFLLISLVSLILNNIIIIICAFMIWLFLKGIVYTFKSITDTYSCSDYSESYYYRYVNKILIIPVSVILAYIAHLYMLSPLAILGAKGLPMALKHSRRMFNGDPYIFIGFLIALSVILSPYSWSILHLIYSFFHRFFRVPEDRRENTGFKPVAIGVFLFYSLACFVFIPNFGRARASGQFAACESNLKNIATALEMYATDNEGYYPPSLEYLTKGDKNGDVYIGNRVKAMPECPVSLTGYKYVFSSKPNNFTLCCGVENSHSAIGCPEGCWPQYTPGRGLEYK